jgi:carbon monoxide dehydrogenase subunit G
MLHPDGMFAVRTVRRHGAGFLIIACAAALLPAQPAAAQDVSVVTLREGEFVTVSATAGMQVDPRIAWEVLSDYDHLAEFIPDMLSSRVVRRNADGILVEQKGEIGFLFFRRPLEVTLAVTEQPPLRILARGVAGNVKDMEARYELQSSEAGVKLDYFGRFIPEFFMPPIIGMAVLRSSMKRQFRAMVVEILRRDALARNKSGK